MARTFKDLKVDEKDGKVYVTLYNRDGSVALRDVAVDVSSKIVQRGDKWTAAAANLLLRIGDDGQPQLALTPAQIGAATAAQGVATYIHAKSGTVHTLTGTGDNIRFVATADFTAGDTVKVNGTTCTASTAGGDALWSGFFKSGAVVICYKNGNKLTFNGGGLPAAELAKLTPENLKTGVSITANGKTVNGNFTADATGGNWDLRVGKTAYVNGKKISGELISRDTGTPNPIDHIRLANGRVEVAPPAGIHGCWWDGGQYSYLSYAQVANAIGLTPDKLRKGQSVIGVNGGYVGCYYLGTGKSFNVSSVPNYRNLTADNFVVEPASLSGGGNNAQGFGWYDNGVKVSCSTSCGVNKWYDPGSGTLSCESYLNWDAAGMSNGGMKTQTTGRNTGDCRVFLIIDAYSV